MVDCNLTSGIINKGRSVELYKMDVKYYVLDSDHPTVAVKKQEQEIMNARVDGVSPHG